MQTIPSNNAISTRILIISDTHDTPLLARDDRDEYQAFRKPLPSADVLIHSGDMTMTGQLHQYEKTLDLLREVDAPVKLVIAGNHDRTLDLTWMKNNPHGLDMTWEERHTQWQEARKMWTSPDGRAQREGVTFLDEGVHSVELKNGARITVYASPYTPDFYSWGFAYGLNEDRFNPPSASLSDAVNIAVSPVPSFKDKQVDVMITHGPPFSRLDTTFRGDKVGCPHLLRSLMRCRPLIHCFGHIHEGWGAERIQWAKSIVNDSATTKQMTIDDLKKRSVEKSLKAGLLLRKNSDDFTVIPIPVSNESALKHRCVQQDLTGSSSLQRGKETLLVNSAIMDAEYKPVNAPWLVTVGLPKA